MATVCVSALPSGDVGRRNRLLNLVSSLAGADENISLVLYGDGIYSLVSGSQAAAELAGAPVKIYAVAGDAEDRGLAGRLIPQAQVIDYTQVVELIMEAEHTITGV
ncbi:MAG: sulfurtransferase complex subunit TusB [Actinobacteria bacterium]|nr:sulfurtransferase complex subunit TusB [Actinomycetota bacterium]